MTHKKLLPRQTKSEAVKKLEATLADPAIWGKLVTTICASCDNLFQQDNDNYLQVGNYCPNCIKAVNEAEPMPAETTLANLFKPK